MERRLSETLIQAIPQRSRKLKFGLALTCSLLLAYPWLSAGASSVASVLSNLATAPTPLVVETLGSKAIYGANITFSQYLDYHFAPVAGLDSTATGPHIWLTTSTQDLLDTSTLALHLFIQSLNLERKAASAKNAKPVRDTALVVLCEDQICVERCRQRGLYCYGGYKFTRPDRMP